MVSLRLPLLSFLIVAGVLASCAKTSTQSETKNISEKQPEPKLEKSAVNNSGVNSSTTTTTASQSKTTPKVAVAEVALTPNIEKSNPNEKVAKNAKVRAVVREGGNSQKVLDLLIPDRKKIDDNKVFVAANKKGQGPTFVSCDAADIPIIRLTNTRFIDEKYPTISGNGAYLVYEGWHLPESGETAPQALYCTKLDATLQRTVLVKNGFNSVRPFFHPNLKEVYFSSDSFKDEFHITSVSLESTGSINLNFRKLCRDELDIAISKKVEYAISYFKEGKSVPSIGLVDSSGVFFPEVTEGKEVAWSQAGDRIVFVNLNGIYLDVYSAKPDGSELVQITTHFGFSHHPSFSPNGDWVVFSALTETTKKYDLFIVRKDGKDLTQITNSTENDKNPYWGIDGWIYFETDRFEGNSEIAKIDGAQFIKKFEEQSRPPAFIK